MSDDKNSDKPVVDENLRPHVYDGIQEYDNRMPNWWLWTFYITIIFSAVYWFTFFDAGIMATDEERMAAFKNEVEEKRLAAAGDVNAATLWEMSGNPGFVSSGEKVYRDHCMACHGANMEGGIGQSLVNDEWVWGNTPMSIYEVVANGSPNRMAGMQAWMNDLGPKRVSQVVAYILSHHTPESLASASSENPPIAE